MDTNIQPNLDGNVSTTTPKVDMSDATIDRLFGTNVGGSNFKSGNDEPGGDTFEDVKPTKSNLSDPTQAFKNPSETIKLLQSERDKAFAEIKKLKEQEKEKENLSAFVEALYKDEQVRRAFIAEVEPELVKSKDPYTFIKESLGKEFGQDFELDRDEVNIPGTKSWLYNRRADELLRDYYQKSSQTPSSIKEVIKVREQKKLEQLRAAEVEKQETMSKLNWDEQAWSGFANWLKSSQTLELGKIYDRLMKSQMNNNGAPYIANQPGFNRNTSNEFEQLSKFFG